MRVWKYCGGTECCNGNFGVGGRVEARLVREAKLWYLTVRHKQNLGRRETLAVH